MKINRQKLDIALAKQCMVMNDLKDEFSPVTLNRLRNDRNYSPTTKTVGRLARALNVPVESIIENED